MAKFKLLTVGNPKIEKSVKFGYLTAVLHLAPGTLSGYNVCPKATAGCLAACLNTAGRGGIVAGNGGRLQAAEIASGQRTNIIQAARIRRTRLYFSARAHFMSTLGADIAKLIKLAAAHGLKPAVRLNGTSDIPWERVPFIHRSSIIEVFPQVQFYDYTKRPNRRDLPANYTLTFSLAEGNDDDAYWATRSGMNVAAVFHKVPASYRLPATRDRLDVHTGASLQTTSDGVTQWVGNVREFPVIDGDEHDLRFLDRQGVIVGLKAKGNAKRDASGFVR